jgi:hypothetical protein
MISSLILLTSCTASHKININEVLTFKHRVGGSAAQQALVVLNGNHKTVEYTSGDYFIPTKPFIAAVQGNFRWIGKFKSKRFPVDSLVGIINWNFKDLSDNERLQFNFYGRVPRFSQTDTFFVYHGNFISPVTQKEIKGGFRFLDDTIYKWLFFEQQ